MVSLAHIITATRFGGSNNEERHLDIASTDCPLLLDPILLAIAIFISEILDAAAASAAVADATTAATSSSSHINGCIAIQDAARVTKRAQSMR